MASLAVRNVVLLLIGSVASMSSSALGSDWYRGVIEYGGSLYYHRVQAANDLAWISMQENSVFTHGGVTAVIFTNLFSDVGNLPAVRHFDRWGNPLHSLVAVGASYPDYLTGCTFDGVTRVFWEDDTHPDILHWRQIAADGTPLTPIENFREFPSNRSLGEFKAHQDAQGMSLVYGEGNATGNINPDVFLLIHPVDGPPIGPITIANTIRTEHWVQVHRLRTGITLTAFRRESNPHQLVLRAVSTTGEPGPEDVLSTTDPLPSNFYGLAHGGATLIYRDRPAPSGTPSEYRAQIFDADGLKVGPSVLLRTSATVGAPIAMPDGRYVISASEGSEQPWIQIADADGAVLTPRLNLTGPTPIPSVDFGFTRRAFAFDESGAIWAVFEAYTGGWRPMLSLLKPLVRGDLNGDGRLDNFDIDAFVLALLHPDAYHTTYPDIPPEVVVPLGDMNDDGLLNNFDIDGFVDALLGDP